MHYTTQLLSGEPIYLTTFGEEFDVREDAPRLMAEMKAVFDSASEPMYMLDDTLRLAMSFSDLVAGLALATRGEMGVARHPKVRKMVVVSTNELVRLGSSALKQVQYGGVKVDVYASVDDALKAIRHEIAEGRR